VTRSCSFFVCNSTYFSPFLVLLGTVQYKPATPRHGGTPNHLPGRLLRCGYNTFLVNTLTQWPPNVHRQKATVFSTQPESSGDDAWRGPVSFSSSLMSGAGLRYFSVLDSSLRSLEAVLDLSVVPLRRKVARIFFQQLFGQCITICLTEHWIRLSNVIASTGFKVTSGLKVCKILCMCVCVYIYIFILSTQF